jgi:hypothetical protein
VNFAHARAPGLPLTTMIAWLASWTLLPAIGHLAIYVPLLFPTGRFLSPGWRAFGLIGLTGAMATTVREALRPGSVAVWVRTEAEGSR